MHKPTQADYQIMDDAKRDALRQGRARWRNAAEAMVTLFKLVESGDEDLAAATKKAEELVRQCQLADKEKRGRRNGR